MKKIIRLNEQQLHGLVRQIILETMDELDLYHGTQVDFNEFSDEFMGSGWGQQCFGDGHYLSTSFETAKEYARGGQVMTCQVPNGPYLSYQSVSPNVANRIARAFFKYYTEEDEYGREAYGECKKEFWENECGCIAQARTGADIYGDIAAIMGSHKHAGEYLRGLGYIGLKFKGDNTNTGEKFWNYVIFDPKDIKIINKTPVNQQ